MRMSYKQKLHHESAELHPETGGDNKTRTVLTFELQLQCFHAVNQNLGFSAFFNTVKYFTVEAT